MFPTKFHKNGIAATAVGSLLALSTVCLADAFQDAQALVVSKKNVQLKAVGGSWVLTGEASYLKEYWELKALVQALKEAGYKVGDSVLLSEAGYEKLISQMSGAMSDREIIVRRVGESVFVEGAAASDFDADKNINTVKMMLAPPTALGSSRDSILEPTPKFFMTIVDMQKIRKKK